MTDPTPTRDEAPDVLAKQIMAAASDMCEIARIAGEWRNGPKQSLTAIREIRAVLASAPAPAICNVVPPPETYGGSPDTPWTGKMPPASGGVDAVAVVHRIRATERYFEAGDRQASERYELTEEQAAALLSPTATPVSEAGGEAWTICAKLRAIAEDGDISVNDGNLIMRAVALIEALAKPASSPAPVRPIGNQGISDYQREIARNMAEGFAAWNAARQEALPSDEPASSPAGGDVVQTLIDKTEKLIEAADDMGWSCNSSSADQAIREARDAVRAALSQSTSAGGN